MITFIEFLLNEAEKKSFAQQRFDTLLSYSKKLTDEQIKEKIKELRDKSKNYLNYSWKQMQDFDAEAKDWEKILELRHQQ